MNQLMNESLLWLLHTTSTGVLPVMKYSFVVNPLLCWVAFMNKKIKQLFFFIKLKPILRTSIFPGKTFFSCIYSMYKQEGFRPGADSSFVFNRKSWARSWACSTIFTAVACSRGKLPACQAHRSPRAISKFRLDRFWTSLNVALSQACRELVFITGWGQFQKDQGLGLFWVTSMHMARLQPRSPLVPNP